MLENYFNVSLIEYFINFIIFGQCLFFMLLFIKSINYRKRYNQKFVEFMFYCLSIAFILIVFVFNINYNFYKTHLIIQYVLLVNIAYYYFRREYKVLTAISLSFLIVFLNSYFWEMVLHFMEYNTNPLTLFNFRETYHLIVIPFLLNYYSFDKRPIIKKIGVTFFISFLIALTTHEIIPYYGLHLIEIPFLIHLSNVLYFINRLFCLMVLINIMISDSHINRKRCDWFI